ncbi:hypothetical protein [Candidatus Albibeggiatoa sp. nov. NOAA]|uniref:nSTAND1 domain-containing NTPase n=1 Tax=Candidatus Albibeggiatoa sp. nov. NOAA TaxID=3162724 RepID=UPI0032F43740|nr:hypothetical protein [Thiotrichaceae bacterium]
MSNNPFLATRLSNHFIFAAFQLLAWALFKPSAWRDCVNRFCPQYKVQPLSYDFCLTHVDSNTWRQWPFIRLLLTYSVFPSIVALILLLSSYYFEIKDVFFAAIGSFIFGVSSAIVVSLLNSFIAGLVASLLLSIVGALLLAQGSLSMLHVISLCFSLGMIGNSFIQTANIQRAKFKPSSLGLIIWGFLVGIVGISVILLIPLFITDDVATSIGITMILSLATIMLTIKLTQQQLNPKVLWLYGLLVVLETAFSIAMFSLDVSGWLIGLARGFSYAILLGAAIALPHLAIRAIFKTTTEQANVAVTVASALVATVLWVALAIALNEEGAEAELSLDAITPFLAAGLASVIAGLSFSIWQGAFIFSPLALLLNPILYFRDRSSENPTLLRWNTTFLTDYKHWTVNLREHVLVVLGKNSEQAQYALERLEKLGFYHHLIDKCLLEKSVLSITEMRKLHREKVQGTKDLNAFMNLSKSLDRSAKLTDTNEQMLHINEQIDEVQKLIKGIENSAETHLLPFAEQWYNNLSKHRTDLYDLADENKLIESPYIVGQPLQAGASLFVGRKRIVTELKNSLFTHDISVFLHGQYRIGKTSLLLNLIGLLRNPEQYVILFVDLQGAISLGKNTAGFFQRISKDMQRGAKRFYQLELPSLTKQQLETDTLAIFDDWLDQVQDMLGDKTLLLTLDEFAKLDDVLCAQRSDFNEDILDAFSNWIQHRPQFQMIITSQSKREFQRWPQLANRMEFRHLAYLDQDEAVRLIEHPVKNFELRYQPEATQSILNLTQGHPALIQAMCREIVAIKNTQDLKNRFSVTLDDVEQSIPKVIEAGQMIFAIFDQKAEEDGRTFLRHLAKQKTVSNIDDFTSADSGEDVISRLERLELIEKTSGEYRFKIELFLRWYLTE